MSHNVLPPQLVTIQGIILEIWHIDFIEDLSSLLYFYFSENAYVKRLVLRKHFTFNTF